MYILFLLIFTYAFPFLNSNETPDKMYVSKIFRIAVHSSDGIDDR